MSFERDANTSATSQGNDDGKGKLPLLNEGNQENTEKKSDGDVSELVKVLVRVTVAEELVKLKAGSGSGTASPILSGSSHSQGEQRSQISPRADAYGMTGDTQFPLSNCCNSKTWGLVKKWWNLRERRAHTQTNEGVSGGEADAESMVK